MDRRLLCRLLAIQRALSLLELGKDQKDQKEQKESILPKVGNKIIKYFNPLLIITTLYIIITYVSFINDLFKGGNKKDWFDKTRIYTYLFSILFSLTMIANKKVRADILETNNQRKKKAAEKLEKAKEAYVLIIHLF